MIRRSLGVLLVVLCSSGLLAECASAQSAGLELGGRMRFEERLGPGLEFRVLPEGGIEGRGALRVAPAIRDAAERERATRRTLAAAEELLGVRGEELVAVLERELAGMHVVQLEQRIEGVALRGSRVDLRFLEDGRLVLLRARGLAAGGLARGFFVEAGEARELARIALPEDPARLAALAARRIALRGADGRARAAWSVDLVDWARADGAWIVTLDGADGTLLEVRSGLVESLDGSVDGRGMASGPQSTGAPSVLPLANVHVSAVDRSAAILAVTDDPCEDEQVAISADGSRVAWVSDCGGDRELWTALSDGTGTLQLTVNAADDHSPVLSADGSLVVFVSDLDGDEELYAIGSDGTGLVQLTANTARDREPSLSGDGARVVYLSDLDGDDEVFTLLVGAPTPTQLTFDLLDDESPRLSLDGSRITWVSRADGDAEIHSMDPAGGAHAQVTVNGVDDLEPDLSPDGARVVFASVLPPLAVAPGDPSLLVAAHARLDRRVLRQFDLFEGAADGSSLTRLTESEADERAPRYAADGQCIAYTTSESGAREVELLVLESGETTRLSESTGDDRAPRPGASCAVGAWIAEDAPGGGDGEVRVWDLGLPGASAKTTTDAAGAFSLPVPDGRTPSVGSALRGLWARVSDLDPRWGEERATGSFAAPSTGADLHLNPAGAVEGPTAQVTAYRHTDLAHAKLESVMRRAPLALAGPLPIDRQLRVRADFPSPVANAFYSLIEKHTTFFVGAGPARPNTAYDTLVQHETGHFYDDRIGGLSAGSACEAPGAQAEGQADVVAMLSSGSAVIGADFFGAGSAIRDYASFPWSALEGAKGRQLDGLDCTPVGGLPEIHEHGQAFAGFAWELRALVGAATAEDLLVGVLLANPHDMPSAVAEAFALAALPAFGGTGDPATSPLYDPLCKAAAMHGFDCPPRADKAAYDCVFAFCPGVPAVHRVIHTERLGLLVVPDPGCEPTPAPELDGVSMPSTLWMGGTPITLTFTLSVDPALRFSGRYGAPLPEVQHAERRVYLNAWLLIDDTRGGFLVHKLLGSGSGSGIVGPDTVEPGLDAVAFNPDTWAGASRTFLASVTPPAFAEARPAILRVRLDYGEDCGRLTGCFSDPALHEQCGPARFGEVEDYQIAIVP